MLDKNAVETFRRRGWLVVENVFTRDEADRIAQVAWEVSQDNLKAEAPKGYLVDHDAEGKAQPRKVDHPFWRREEFRKFVLDQRVKDLVGQLVDDPNPLLATDQIFMKPPRFGSAKPYHQDNFYFQMFPADKVITAWIALDDVDESNGCLRYIDGSHLGPILSHDPIPGEPHNLAPKPELIDLKKESLAIVGKGGIVFHHSQTLHTSHRNESERWRRAYATHWVTADVTCKNDVLDDAYFKTNYTSPPPKKEKKPVAAGAP
jgi:ectoine hydroxylase-related dioxygenase (phytanoyl-CoA dioxygenase family)